MIGYYELIREIAGVMSLFFKVHAQNEETSDDSKRSLL